MGFLDALAGAGRSIAEQPERDKRIRDRREKEANNKFATDYSRAVSSGDVELMRIALDSELPVSAEVRNKALTDFSAREREFKDRRARTSALRPAAEREAQLQIGEAAERGDTSFETLLGITTDVGDQLEAGIDPGAVRREIDAHELTRRKLEAEVTAAERDAAKLPRKWLLAKDTLVMIDEHTGEHSVTPFGFAKNDRARNALVKAQEDAAKMLARGEQTPRQAVTFVKMQVEAATGRAMPEEDLIKLKIAYKPYGLRPLQGLGQEQMKKISGGTAVQEVAERALDKLLDPKVQAALGKFGTGGITTKFQRWVTGDAKMPAEVQSFLSAIGMTQDYLSRKQSGAALTQTELDFYASLIGDVWTDPDAVKQRLVDLISIQEIEKQSIYKMALGWAEGGEISPEQAEGLDFMRFKSKYLNPETDLAWESPEQRRAYIDRQRSLAQ